MVNSLTDNIYRLRLNNQLEAGLNELINLKVIMEEEFSGNFFRQLQSDPEKSQTYLSWIAIEASFNRRFSGLSESQLTLDKANKINSGFRQQSFYLQMEYGLNSLVQGNYSDAMAFFIKCKLISKDNTQKRWALINIIICKEALSLPYLQTLEELDQTPKSKLLSVEEQIQAFRFRNHFKTGDIKEIINQKSSISTQAGFYQVWVSRIPYHRYYNDLLNASVVDSLLKMDELYLNRYRANTLAEFYVSQDSQIERSSDFVERLYLWVWQWLVNSDQDHFDKVIRLLAESDFDSLIIKMGREDRLQCQNALLWLKLMLNQNSDKIEHYLRFFNKRESCSSSLYQYENLIIQYLMALKNSEFQEALDIKNIIMSHPVNSQKDILLSSLIDHKNSNDNGSKLKKLSKRIAEILNYSLEAINNKIIINETNNTILLNDEKISPVCSELLTKTAIHMYNNPISSEIDFVREVFGISNYDVVDHQRKIFNILNRFNLLFTSNKIKLRVKERKIIAEGSWDDFHFKTIPLFQKQIDQSPSWYRFNKENITDTFQPKKKRHFLPNIVTRPQLEKILNKSRSAMNRLLLKWDHQGLLKKEGCARNTRYILKESLLESIKAGDVV